MAEMGRHWSGEFTGGDGGQIYVDLHFGGGDSVVASVGLHRGEDVSAFEAKGQLAGGELRLRGAAPDGVVRSFNLTLESDGELRGEWTAGDVSGAVVLFPQQRNLPPVSPDKP